MAGQPHSFNSLFDHKTLLFTKEQLFDCAHIACLFMPIKILFQYYDVSFLDQELQYAQAIYFS